MTASHEPGDMIVSPASSGVSLGGGALRDLVDVVQIVDQLQLLDGAHWRIAPFQRSELRRSQRLHDGSQAFGRLRMVRPGAVFETRGMGINNRSCHVRLYSVSTGDVP